MSDPEICQIVREIVAKEGGYTNDPTDRGGPTKFGITLATLRNYRHALTTERDVEQLTLEEAVEIYKDLYVSPFLGVFDRRKWQGNDGLRLRFLAFCINAAVQHGVRRAVLLLQQSVNAYADGKIGPITEAAVLRDPMQALLGMIAGRAAFYGDILARDRSQWKYAAGWFRRFGRDMA